MAVHRSAKADEKAAEAPDRAPAATLTHVDERGRARMVPVHGKAETVRVAVAEGRLLLRPATLQRVLGGEMPKGDVLPVARVAAIQAAKRTADLIPLCHPLRITAVEVDFAPELGVSAEHDAIRIRVQVTAHDRTGVEMEALTAVSVAALTLYDMAKAVDKDMRISEIHLIEKRGGQHTPAAQEM